MAIVKRAITVRQSDRVIMWRDDGPGNDTWVLTSGGTGRTTVTFPTSETFTGPPVVLAGCFALLLTAPVSSGNASLIEVGNVSATGCIVYMRNTSTYVNGTFTIEVVGEVA